MPAPPERLDRKGTRTLDGRYSLVRFVGEGGMGEVWHAVDNRLQRDVALKFPKKPLSESPAEHWLSAEAQTVARLSHPHIVSLLDRTVLPAGTDASPREGELPALVFQYVLGRPLNLWADQPRPWSWLRRVAEQILDALSYGAPPHGGIAFGLDRLVMHMCATDNIREVMAFPKTMTGQDLMCEAPNVVDDDQLHELHVKSTATTTV